MKRMQSMVVVLLKVRPTAARNAVSMKYEFDDYNTFDNTADMYDDTYELIWLI
jgi:hypothetical protein